MNQKEVASENIPKIFIRHDKAPYTTSGIHKILNVQANYNRILTNPFLTVSELEVDVQRETSSRIGESGYLGVYVCPSSGWRQSTDEQQDVVCG